MIKQNLAMKYKLENIIKVFLIATNHKDVVMKILSNNGLKVMLKVLAQYLPEFKEGQRDEFIENIIEVINKVII